MPENVTMQKSLPVETIVHRTASRPFSFYRTVVERKEPCALYLHCHPEAEIFYLEHGLVDFQVEKRSFTLGSGEGIFIPPGQIHTALNRTEESDCCYRAFVFDPGMVERNLPPYCQVYFAPLQLRRADCVYPIVFASLCGFNNISYFNRTFYKMMGTAPSAYRRNGNSRNRL